MKRETTSSRSASHSGAALPMTLLVATIYGMTAGMALALAVGAGLLPVNWGAAFPGAPSKLSACWASPGQTRAIAISQPPRSSIIRRANP